MRLSVLAMTVGLLLCSVAKANEMPEALAATVEDKETTEDALDASQPTWNFTVSSDQVSVAWNYGMTVPSVKINGVTHTATAEGAADKSSWRVVSVDWIVFQLYLAKNLAPALRYEVRNRATPPSAHSSTNGFFRRTSSSIVAKSGQVIVDPTRSFIGCVCYNADGNPPGGGCSEENCRDQSNCPTAPGFCSYRAE